MTQETVLNFLNQYGLICVFVVVFLEYLNFPGLPAAVIFPAVGVWSSYSGTSFVLSSLVCVVAGVCAGSVSYYIGYKGGTPLIEKITRRFGRFKKYYDKYSEKIQNNDSGVILICRIVPTIRTIIGYIAGAMRLNFWRFTLFSFIGIAINNALYMAAGVGLFSAFFEKMLD